MGIQLWLQVSEVTSHIQEHQDPIHLCETVYLEPHLWNKPLVLHRPHRARTPGRAWAGSAVSADIMNLPREQLQIPGLLCNWPSCCVTGQKGSKCSVWAGQSKCGQNSYDPQWRSWWQTDHYSDGAQPQVRPDGGEKETPEKSSVENLWPQAYTCKT